MNVLLGIIVFCSMLKIIKQLNRFSSVRDKIKKERETRLGQEVSETILPTKSVGEIDKIRNVGIIAHIDAGKTTTTERMLYYAGALPSPGDIDEGTTTMDYMKQQRQRGITIRSAAITFNWKSYQINLIDTPGHVDFSGEVARSLKVLDGAVTILDGVKGVEAQTIKVWEQAKRRNIPRICYVNKLDRMGASILQTAESIKKRLQVEPLIMQMPIGESELFKGVIDLLTMKQIFFEGPYGNLPKVIDIDKSHPKYAELEEKRLALIEKIADHDEQIGDLYLSQKPVSAQKLKTALRRVLSSQNENKLCPIYMGTSFKNKGVQPLIDAITELLPSPNEREPVYNIEDPNEKRRPEKSEPLSAYVFKILYDLEMGPLAYARIYSGEMKRTTGLINSTSSCPEKIGHIYRVRANQYITVNSASTGDIVAVSGLKDTKAGDTLNEFGTKKFVLDKLELPSAIFTVPFELESNKYSKSFKDSIERATIEDNSLIYQYEAQTGQYLLSGLGQLHLQILRDQMIADGIPVKMGNLKINYKETIRSPLRDELKIRRQLKNGQYEEFQIELQIIPKPRNLQGQKMDQNNSIEFAFEKVKDFDENWNEFLKRKIINSKERRAAALEQDQTQQNFMKVSKRSVRNPTPVEPLEASSTYDEQKQDEDEQSTESLRNQDNEPLYHISTLPFETLYEIYETCRFNLLHGRRDFPVVGVDVKIRNGVYTKSTFNKGVANRCSTELLRKMLNQSCVLLEPMMEFVLQGEEPMIEIVVRQILGKRGFVDVHEVDKVEGKIPASEVRGWVKELRSMGLEVELKFKDYEEAVGVDPEKLIRQ